MRQMLRDWTNMSVIQAMDRIMFHTHLRISQHLPEKSEPFAFWLGHSRSPPATSHGAAQAQT